MTATKKLMDCLARRSHSEMELREKLSPNFEADEITKALEYAKANGWLEDPLELAQRTAESLNLRGKGYEYINAYLHSKGLPSIPMQSSSEMQKGLRVIQKHLKIEPPYAAEATPAIIRLLKNRGFDHDTIQKLVHDPF